MENVYSIFSVQNKVQGAIEESKTNLFEDDAAGVTQVVKDLYKKVLDQKFKVHNALTSKL